MTIETEQVGVAYSATAMGLVVAFSGIGGVIAPPIGNSLAAIGAGLPFVFWAGLAMAGFITLYAVKERSAESVLVVS